MSKKQLFVVVSAITVLFLGIAGYFITQAMTSVGDESIYYYRLAFYTFLFLILLIKIRVSIGFRIVREHLFRAHLTTAIVFFLCLTGLAFLTQATWLAYFMWALYSFVMISGVMLFYRGTLKALAAEI